jgi:hypothetical protein
MGWSSVEPGFTHQRDQSIGRFRIAAAMDTSSYKVRSIFGFERAPRRIQQPDLSIASYNNGWPEFPDSREIPEGAVLDN